MTGPSERRTSSGPTNDERPASDATVALAAADAAAAVAVAVRAPSIHNTQPWSWRLHGGVLSLRADRTRQLKVLDSDAHGLLISCGAALAAAEMGLRAQGWDVDVRRTPDEDDPDLLAELRGLRPRPATAAEQAWVDGARQRRSERRPFAPGAVSHEQIERLRRAAESARAFAHFPTRQEETIDLAVAVSHADRVERQDAEYLAELATWLRSDASSDDGVPATAVAHVPAGSQRRTNVPLRDFEVGITGAQLLPRDVVEHPQLAVVLTEANWPIDQLSAGESTMHLMVEAELAGLSTCALSQAIDMLVFRSRLRGFMDWQGYPQMMLRIGPRPMSEPPPLTRRRPVTDVLDVD